MSEPPPRSFAPRAAAAWLASGGETVLCFSAPRWDLAFQRTQQLMTRFAQRRRVIYWQAPAVGGLTEQPHMDLQPCRRSGVITATPHLPLGLNPAATQAALRRLLDDLCTSEKIVKPLLWYSDPDMLAFSGHLAAAALIYDCTDGAACDAELLERADLVFTSGYGLYQARRHANDNIHPFPAAVDHHHFAKARTLAADIGPDDQATLARPRLGFHGVVDDRIDLDLLAHLADARPDWALVVLAPVVTISPSDLPSRPNIRWLGGKAHADLPRYLAGWDVAIAPLKAADRTRLQSPEETPQYLAAGLPVVTTTVAETLLQYRALDAVQAADTPAAFVQACERALKLAAGDGAWLAQADKVLTGMAWDETFARMSALVDLAVMARPAAPQPQPSSPPADRPPAAARPSAMDGPLSWTAY